MLQISMLLFLIIIISTIGKCWQLRIDMSSALRIKREPSSLLLQMGWMFLRLFTIQVGITGLDSSPI